MAHPATERHLLRARDLADSRYAEQIDVAAMAAAAGLSRAHFTRSFTRAFGESPGAYLLTRRLERAAALLRNTDHSVAEVSFEGCHRAQGIGGKGADRLAVPVHR